ncbi:MAG TPA: hypothetical protein VH855_16370 [Acetobacteraceae bacterium]|jgi:hypothetical protein
MFLFRSLPALLDLVRKLIDYGKDLAATLHRRVAAIADICRDLNILPSHPLWRELMRAIIMHGGNYARMVMDQLRRLFPYHTEPEPAWLLPPPAPAATGPRRANPPRLPTVRLARLRERQARSAGEGAARTGKPIIPAR